MRCQAVRRALCGVALNAIADMQITDLLPAYRAIISQNHRFYDIRAPLKNPSEKKAAMHSICCVKPSRSAKARLRWLFLHYCTYLLFLTQNGFLEMPIIKKFLCAYLRACSASAALICFLRKNGLLEMPLFLRYDK